MRVERGSRRPPLVALMLLAPLFAGPRSRAENQVAFKEELYQEDGGRMKILTESALFDITISPALTLKGDYVYDGISGATPYGAPPLPGTHKVPLSKVDDVRQAGSLEAITHFRNHTLTPQFSYSSESDYRSLGIALNDAIEFNEKNTTLLLGAAHSFDENQPTSWKKPKHKDSSDFLVGVSQLLDPRTVLTLNATVGYSDGYLNDPYKLVRFDDYPDPNGVFPEKRPSTKTKLIGQLGLTHFFTPVNGSLESSYRFYHDTFGINSHTVELAWYQKFGKHIIVSPMFRYYYQTAASFYAPHFPGDPSDPDNPTPIPHHYSADYRLSELNTFTYGAKIIYQINEHFRVDLAYKRYEMHGLDGATSASAYPKAHVVTIGGTWNF